MEKQSIDLLNLALLSLLAGGGTYAAARGVKDLGQEIMPHKPETNELEITLPKSRMPAALPKQKMGTDFSDMVMPPIAAGAGAYGGFHLASKIYEKLKERSLLKQKDKVEQDYLSTLMHAHSKVAEVQTPHIDSFLEGIVSNLGVALEKAAWTNPDFVTDGGILDVPSGVATNAAHGFMNSNMGKMTGATMLLTALMGAGLTYGTAKRMANKEDEREHKSAIPQDVRLRLV